MPRPEIKTWFSAWVPPLIWGTIIWQLGSDDFSESETRSLFGPLIAWLLPWLTPEHWSAILWTLRKLAHPAVYGLLALLCWRGATLSLNTGRRIRSAWTLVPVGVLALADEGTQLFSQSRSGALGDVLLDLTGGVAVVLAIGRIEALRGETLFGRRRLA